MSRLKLHYSRFGATKVIKRAPSQERAGSLQNYGLRVLVGVVLGVCIGMMLAIIYLNHETAYRKLKMLRQALRSKNHSDSASGYIIYTKRCRIREIIYNDPSVMREFFSDLPVTCNTSAKPFLFDYEMNLTEGKSCITFNEKIFAQHYRNVSGNFKDWECLYTETIRDTKRKKRDQHWDVGPLQSLSVGACPKEEFFWIQCNSRNGTIIYEQPMAPPMVKPASRAVVPNNRGQKPLNVLVLGYDSLSRLNVYRQLPKTVEFLRRKPRLAELFGYNKIGLNSAPNQIALLTGIRYLEPGLGSRVGKKYFDNLTRYLWQDFEFRGFRTMFFEEQWQYGLFTYPPMFGFKEVQTTYWPRHWMQSIDLSSLKESGRGCLGPHYPAKYYLKYIADTLEILGPDRPLFAYGWLSELTHDDVNGGRRLDEDLLNFFVTMEERGTLDNTAVFFISDHGMRWGYFRRTETGKHEDMLPFGFILMPKQFFDVYPEASENLKINSRRLVTVYDLYASLMELGDVWEDRRVSRTGRGYSLFSSIVPEDRSCSDAGIDYQFCSCYEPVALNTSSPAASALLRAAIKGLNSAVAAANLTKLCRVWNASRVKTFHRLYEGDSPTKFHRIAFKTTPEANFEVVAELAKDEWHVGSIDRTNLYSRHARCAIYSEWRKLCYCKKNDFETPPLGSGSTDRHFPTH